MYFASYQHYFYYTLFWGLLVMIAIHAIYRNEINPYQYYGSFAVLCVLYIILTSYYGIHKYLPHSDVLSLSKANSFLPSMSNIPKESNNGFTFYSKIYITNFDFNPTSRIFNAPGLFTVEYDGVSGNLMVHINSKMQSAKLKSLAEQTNPGSYGSYDNVLIIKDIPLQRYNDLFLICNQDKCFVFFNDAKYVINIDFYPSKYYGSVLVGQDKGVSGKAKSMLYLPYAISLDAVPKIRHIKRNEAKYVLNIIPYL